MTLDYGNYGIFFVMGNAGYISSTVTTLTPMEALLAPDAVREAASSARGLIGDPKLNPTP